MTRLPHYKRISNSAEAILERSVLGTPTPWNRTGWYVDGKPVQVQFRLWVKRRGRCLYVETSHDSVDYPSLRIPVRTSRQGMLTMIKSGYALVRMSVRDPASISAAPRYRYNKQHREFADGAGHLRVVAEHLDRIFNPRRGRPRKRPPIISEAMQPGSVPVTTRMKRRTQILEFTTRTKDLLDPILELTRDGRSMKGFDPRSQLEIKRALHAIQTQVRELHTLVYFGIAPGTQPTQNAAVPASRPSTIGQLPTFDFDLEPTPVGISYNETPENADASRFTTTPPGF